MSATFFFIFQTISIQLRTIMEETISIQLRTIMKDLQECTI